MRKVIFVLMLFFSSQLIAEDIANIFQIEIIFFEHNDPKRFAAEKWPKHIGKLDTKKAIKLNSLPKGIPDSLDTLQILDALDDVDNEPIKDVIPETVTLVEPSKRLLNNDAQIIKNSKDDRYIDHIAWNQALAWNVRSTPVFIAAGKDGAEISSVVSIKPVKGTYQMSVDVIYNAAQDKANNTGINEFRIIASPRLKKKEVYYLDHPIIGALIIVSPVIEEY